MKHPISIVYRVKWHIILIYIYRSRTCDYGRGRCSPVSPIAGYHIIGPCSDPESGIESEECFCWSPNYGLDYEPFAANP